MVELYELIALDDCNPVKCLCGAAASSLSTICFFLNVSAADKGLLFVLLFVCFFELPNKKERSRLALWLKNLRGNFYAATNKIIITSEKNCISLCILDA